LLSQVIGITTGYEFTAYPGVRFHQRPEWLHHRHHRGLRDVAKQTGYQADPHQTHVGRVVFGPGKRRNDLQQSCKERKGSEDSGSIPQHEGTPLPLFPVTGFNGL
jgi:hypothetical protein